MTRTALYRHYDEAARLLYVGISGDPTRRTYQHRCNAEWADCINATTIEWFKSRADALTAEAAAIASETPIHNVFLQTEGDRATVCYTIANALGRCEMEARLRLKRGSVSMALGRGSFPARWFLVVRQMCADAGIECPESAFAFKSDAESSEPTQ